MAQLVKPAMVGSLESSDAQIRIEPNPGKGIEIHMESVVKVQFGDSILATARAVLDEFGVTDALVSINDKGAVDCAIRARMQAAVCRASETSYDWTREDKGVGHGR